MGKLHHLSLCGVSAPSAIVRPTRAAAPQGKAPTISYLTYGMLDTSDIFEFE